MLETAGRGHASPAVGARYMRAGTNQDDWVKISDAGLSLDGKDNARIVISTSGNDGPYIEVADSQGYTPELGVSSQEFPKC